jgi:hypothetical protein
MTDSERRVRFEKALHRAGDTHTVGDVLDKVEAGRAQFWNYGDGNVVTEVLTYPRLKAVNYWIVSGALPDCAALQPDIDAWALEQGCAVATAVGRMGWLRLSQTPFGAAWKPRGVAFVKSLGDL